VRYVILCSLLAVYPSTSYHIPANSNLQIHHCENLKSHSTSARLQFTIILKKKQPSLTLLFTANSRQRTKPQNSELFCCGLSVNDAFYVHNCTLWSRNLSHQYHFTNTTYSLWTPVPSALHMLPTDCVDWKKYIKNNNQVCTKYAYILPPSQPASRMLHSFSGSLAISIVHNSRQFLYMFLWYH
jgi:hypothetical protein